jgi:hypothetical protein
MTTPVMASDTYENTVQRLSAIYFRSGLGGSELASILGCTTLQYAGSVNTWRLSESEEPSPDDEALVRNTLFELLSDLRPHYTGTEMRLAVLDGLGKRARWKSCLQSEIGTYLLAWNLINFPRAQDSTVSKEGGIRLRDATAPHACAILNEWLGSRTDTAPPCFEPNDLVALTPRDVACLLYGKAWCDIVTPINEEPLRDWSNLLFVQRPPFLPGLLPSQFETAAIALPSMYAA